MSDFSEFADDFPEDDEFFLQDREVESYDQLFQFVINETDDENSELAVVKATSSPMDVLMVIAFLQAFVDTPSFELESQSPMFVQFFHQSELHLQQHLIGLGLAIDGSQGRLSLLLHGAPCTLDDIRRTLDDLYQILIEPMPQEGLSSFADLALLGPVIDVEMLGHFLLRFAQTSVPELFPTDAKRVSVLSRDVDLAYESAAESLSSASSEASGNWFAIEPTMVNESYSIVVPEFATLLTPVEDAQVTELRHRLLAQDARFANRFDQDPSTKKWRVDAGHLLAHLIPTALVSMVSSLFDIVQRRNQLLDLVRRFF